MDQVATRKRRCRSASEWSSIMARQEASRLSVESFCDAEGIGRSAFWRWWRRLSDEDAARTGDGGGAAFVELSAAQPASWDVELELGAGVVLRVRRPAC